MNKLQRLYLVMAAMLMGGCSAPDLAPPTKDLGSFFWGLSLNHPAIQLSVDPPYDTVQLHLTAFGADETPLSSDILTGLDAQAPVWSSSDSSRVSVSNTGFVSALAVTSRVNLTVRQTIGGVTRTERVWVRVTSDADRRVLDTFTIQPTDSFKRALANIIPYIFPARATDPGGAPITGLPMRWWTSDNRIAYVSSPDAGMVSISQAKPFWVFAQTYAYGIAKRDSFQLDVGYPISLAFPAASVNQRMSADGTVIFAPDLRVVRIGPGGSALFLNNSGFGPTNVNGATALPGKTIDIVFDDPDVALAVGTGLSGNIIGLQSDTTLSKLQREQSRRFVTAGEHFFTVLPFNVRGSIYVHEK